MNRATTADRARTPGWLMISVAFIILSLVAGYSFYAMAIFIDELNTVRGFDVTVASLGLTVSSVASGFFGLVVARLMRRVPTRLLVVVGSFVAGCGISWIGNTTQVWSLYLAFAIFGIGMATMGNVPLTNLIARRFHPTPARAIAISTTGMSVGGAILPPLVLALVAGVGIGSGALVLGIGLLVITAVGMLLIREPPFTEADAAIATTNTVPGTEPLVIEPEGSRRRYRLPRGHRGGVIPLAVGFGLLIFSSNGSATHILGIGREQGIGNAGIALTVIAISSLISRTAGIWLVDRLGIRWFCLIVTLVQVVAQLVIAGARGLPQFIVGSALLGSTIGNIFVLMALFVLAGFPLAIYAPAYAIVGLGTTAGGSLGPLAVGALASVFGSYSPAVVFCAAASLAGSLVIFSTRIDTDRRKRAVGADPSPEPVLE